jgi:hypothetical protein
MLHTELPIYKKGCELVSLAFHVQTQMRRDFKRSLGEKITGHCTEMVNLMALANASRQRLYLGWDAERALSTPIKQMMKA